MVLVTEVFNLARLLPGHEQFGLASQLRRCAVSIPSNIAEGYARETRKEYLRHLVIARASLAELETQLLIATRVGYAPQSQVAVAFRIQREVGALLMALMKKLGHGVRRVPT